MGAYHIFGSLSWRWLNPIKLAYSPNRSDGRHHFTASAFNQLGGYTNRVFTRSGKRPANFQQTSSKCIQNTGELLDVCWKFAGRLLPYVIMELDVCWKFAGRLLDRVNTP